MSETGEEFDESMCFRPFIKCIFLGTARKAKGEELASSDKWRVEVPVVFYEMKFVSQLSKQISSLIVCT